MADVVLWFNPRCSKCRRARELLDERSVHYELLEYLDTPPSRDEIERLLALLGADDPAVMMRSRDPTWAELELASAPRDAKIVAMLKTPALIERPIVVRGDRAVIARPPEKLLELL